MPESDPELWGTCGNLTADQDAALLEMRRRVKEGELVKHYSDDRSLLRFCRARKFNVDKAFAMLLEDDKWRSEYRNHEFCLQDFSSLLALADDGVVRCGGRDKQGRPVIYVHASKFFPSMVTSKEELLLFYAYYMDSLLKLADKSGREDFTVIADLKGWTFRNFSLELLKLMINILQNYYPERLGRVCVVSSPLAFRAAWNMILPLLDERTRIKIHVLGKNPAPDLLGIIDESSLETAYGGKHVDYPVRDELIKPLYEKEERLQAEAAGLACSSSDEESVVAQIEAITHQGKPVKKKRNILSRISLRHMVNKLTRSTTVEDDAGAGSPTTTPRNARTGFLSRYSTKQDREEATSPAIVELDQAVQKLAQDVADGQAKTDQRIAELTASLKALGSQEGATTVRSSGSLLQLLLIAVLIVQLYCVREISLFKNS